MSTTTLADRILARDDSMLDAVRRIGPAWSVVHLATPGRASGGTRVATVLEPDVLTARLALVRRHRPCDAWTAARRFTDALVWTLAAPPLATLVMCGVGLSSRPEDVTVRIDPAGRLRAVLVGGGPVALLNDAERATAQASALLAPWVGEQLDEGLRRVVESVSTVTGSDTVVWKRHVRSKLLAIRRHLATELPAGVPDVDAVVPHLQLVTQRLRRDNDGRGADQDTSTLKAASIGRSSASTPTTASNQ